MRRPPSTVFQILIQFVTVAYSYFLKARKTMRGKSHQRTMTVKSPLKWQKDSRKSWAYMLLYWCMGWTVGFFTDNLSTLVICIQDPVGVLATPPTAIAIVLIAAIQAHLNTRYSKFGRQSNILVALLFGVCNGTAETMLFLASYDMGRVQICNSLKCSNFVAISIGFLIYFCYSGIIHAFFWLPMAFPRHVRVRAPSFVINGLPALILLSTIWLTLYETQSRVRSVSAICLSHALVDTWTAMVIGLPPPFFSVLRKPNRL